MNSKGFFDETSDKWIRFYRSITILEFFLLIIGGIIGGIVTMVEEELLIGLAIITGGIGGAFLELAVNMLFIQLLNNVQTIRKRMESLPAELAKTIKQTSNSAAPGSETKRGISEEVPELPEL